MRKKKRYRILKKKSIFKKGPVHLLDYDLRLEHGTLLSRQILRHPGAAVIIPKTASRKYILVRQFRLAADSWMWEFPAGGLERGEAPKEAAQRELREEIGFRAKKMKLLVQFYPTPGISSEKMHLFLAENLVADHLPPDHDEELETKAFSLREIGEMIAGKDIVDGKTILGYLCLKYKFRVG